MRRAIPCLALVLAAAVGSAAPPEAPAEVTAKPGRVKELVLKAPAGKSLEFRYVGAPAAFREMKGDSETERVFWLVPEEDGPGHIVWWFTGEKGSSVTAVNKGPAPKPPEPEPVPPPKPKPDPPKPPEPDGPLRVIFVYESGAALTAAQNAVMYGAKVREYLDANSKGWRRYDKDVDATNEKDADIRGLWADAKGKVTRVPCVVVARGKAAEILDLPASEDAAVELFKKYGGK